MRSPSRLSIGLTSVRERHREAIALGSARRNAFAHSGRPFSISSVSTVVMPCLLNRAAMLRAIFIGGGATSPKPTVSADAPTMAIASTRSG